MKKLGYTPCGRPEPGQCILKERPLQKVEAGCGAASATAALWSKCNRVSGAHPALGKDSRVHPRKVADDVPTGHYARLSLARVQLVECALQLFKLLSSLAELTFCRQALVVSKVFGGFRNQRVKVR
jgi:hypothetical protein